MDAVEIWHWYAGAALDLQISPDGRRVETHRLGPRIDAGERPQFAVPAGCWQSAVPDGEWSLAGCTVSPGFVFEEFDIATTGWRPGG